MIPILDLTEGRTIENGKKLVSILSTVGFVYLKNHGVSADKIRLCRRAFFEYFEQGEKEKQSYYGQDDPLYGYLPFESEKLNPIRKERDARESISFPAHDIRGSKFPNTEIADAVVDLVGELEGLGDSLLEMIGIGLELSDPRHLCTSNDFALFLKKYVK